jgi:hypothetical protein
MCEESPNGEANRRLASSERRSVLTSVLGRRATKREASADITLFIGEGEREREAVLGVLPDRWNQARCRVPHPELLTGGPRSGF